MVNLLTDQSDDETVTLLLSWHSVILFIFLKPDSLCIYTQTVWALLLFLSAPFQRALFLVILFRFHELSSINHSLQSLHLIVSLSMGSPSSFLLFYELPIPLLQVSFSSTSSFFIFHEISSLQRNVLFLSYELSMSSFLLLWALLLSHSDLYELPSANPFQWAPLLHSRPSCACSDPESDPTKQKWPWI
jgi:hypothetical protein